MRSFGRQQHVNLANDFASFQAYNGGGVLTYRAVRETAAAAATLEIYDGSGTTGYLIDTIELAASGYSNESYGIRGLEFKGGLYLNVVAGSMKGGLTFVPVDDWEEHEHVGLVVNIPIDEIAQLVTPAIGG